MELILIGKIPKNIETLVGKYFEQFKSEGGQEIILDSNTITKE